MPTISRQGIFVGWLHAIELLTILTCRAMRRACKHHSRAMPRALVNDRMFQWIGFDLREAGSNIVQLLILRLRREGWGC
eukprot:6645068-Pyramimonas_sp.AAC.2